MKLTDIYNSIKEEMSDEDIVAILKKQLNPKSTVKVNKPVVKPNVIYTDKVNEGPIERREYKGLSYIVRYDAPKGYIAIGKGEIENEIAPQYFDKLDDADEHAELEIDGYLSSDINEEFKRMQELAGI